MRIRALHILSGLRSDVTLIKRYVWHTTDVIGEWNLEPITQTRTHTHTGVHHDVLYIVLIRVFNISRSYARNSGTMNDRIREFDDVYFQMVNDSSRTCKCEWTALLSAQHLQRPAHVDNSYC